MAEDAGAAADVADKVHTPDNNHRYKAHSQGRRTHQMPVLHHRLRCNHKVQAYNSRDHSSTLVRLHSGNSITRVASKGGSTAEAPVSRSTAAVMVVRTRRDRVHPARPVQCVQHAGQSIPMRNSTARRWTIVIERHRTTTAT